MFAFESQILFPDLCGKIIYHFRYIETKFGVKQGPKSAENFKKMSFLWRFTGFLERNQANDQHNS